MLFAEALDVVVEGLLNDAERVLARAHLVDGGFLVLKILVYREEVAHLLEDMLRELVDVVVHIVVRVVEGNRNYLLVVSAVVYHRDDTYRIGAYKGHRLDRLGADEKHVKRVSVITVGAGDKAVICRIVGGRVKNSVENEEARLLVELVLFLAALGYFYDADKVGGGYSFRRYVVPDV